MKKAETAKMKLGLLAKVACGLELRDAYPFINERNVRETQKFWDVFGLSSDSRTDWFNLKDGAKYTPTLQETANTLMQVLQLQLPPKKRAIYFDDRSTVGDILDAAHCLWGDDAYCQMLKDCADLVEGIHETRLANPKVPSKAPSLPSMPDRAKILSLPDVFVPISIEGRRNLFLRPPEWLNICGGGYCVRPVLDEIVENARTFLSNSVTSINEFKIPVFWIGGRSGDGKSILLLQTVRALLTHDPTTKFLHFTDPDQLLAWLDVHQGDLDTGSSQPPIVAVVDDLHKCLNWGEARDILERVATRRTGIALFTCGPTPERGLFITAMDGTLAVAKMDARMIGVDDRAALARHLELDIPQNGENEAQTVVEMLFLARQGSNQSLAAFANSLRARVDGYADQAGLFKQLIAMTMLDLELPLSHVTEASRNWLTELAAETQLHVGISDEGYRFGHPAIASNLFDALTRSPTQIVSIEQRMTDVLLPVLENYPANRINQALRQIVTRARVIDANDSAVVETIFTKSVSSALKQAATIVLLSQVIRAGDVAGTRLVNTARAARDAQTTAPAVRGDLASRLAITKNASNVDQEKAIGLLSDVEVGPHMSLLIHWLASEKGQVLRRGRFKTISEWILNNEYKSVSQTMLGKYVKERVPDEKLKQLVQRHIDSVGIQTLSSTYIASLSKRMENTFHKQIKEWLDFHCESYAAAGVYAGLLSKPMSGWYDAAFEYLDQLDWSDAKTIKAVDLLLSHLDGKKVKDRHLAISVETKLSKLFDDIAENLDETTIFLRLSHRHNVADNQRIDHRLNLLKQVGENAYPEFLRLLASAWPELCLTQAERTGDVVDLFARVPEVDPSSKAGKAVMAAASEILLNGKRNVGGYAHALLDLFGLLGSGELRGLIASRLLQVIANPNSRQGTPDTEQLLVPFRNDLRREAWLHARGGSGATSLSTSQCGVALIDSQAVDEFAETQLWIEGGYRTDLSKNDIAVLSAWLRNKHGRSHAWSLLCDKSFEIGNTGRVKDAVVARNLDIVFPLLCEPCRDGIRKVALQRLESGIGDFEWNAGAAWAAYQRRAVWPECAEQNIWRGILKAAYEGDVLDPALFNDDYANWQLIHRGSAPT